MFERLPSGERSVLVHIGIGEPADEDQLSEFRHLTTSAGAEPAGVLTAVRQRPDPRYFAGSGKVEEIAALVEAEQAELVIFDNALSPSQERNLEKALKCRVIDRTGLILDVFAQRARTFEGMLQVELAQLRHLSTRLVRGWTHLERQKGGIGLRGPGETQLETDRRLLGKRISVLRDRLEKVDRQREQGRRSRKKAEVPTLSLVGYTNAGKSTLFNRLTAADVYAADQLFATLDPTLRRIELPTGPLVLADTVGFISHLPHELVAAFRSTLQETVEADLLLHVIDAANPLRDQQMAEVEKVLEQIGAHSVPRINLFNKIDQLPGVTPHVDRDSEGGAERIWLSGMDGEGIDLLLEELGRRFSQDSIPRRFVLCAGDGRLRALLFESGEVLSETPVPEGGSELVVRLPERLWRRLLKQEEALGERLRSETVA
ncbi:MAG: GTPase HflX [Gammaproteobacteria bacterium RIFOXYA12_FULL_61_12]|nr:MAG: GTPase HflX [Gammaproteobacteria bacterium RIFOXYD12_FULL_61_37]OGT94143.1 MAG: GTPase HflX [Gammaproteobacteria bacterium RIFOXYA12_FULL_61_12]